MADDIDTTAANATPNQFAWFDNPDIQQKLMEAVHEAEQVAIAEGALPRDLAIFYLEKAASFMGVEVWELYSHLTPEGESKA